MPSLKMYLLYFILLAAFLLFLYGVSLKVKNRRKLPRVDQEDTPLDPHPAPVPPPYQRRGAPLLSRTSEITPWESISTLELAHEDGTRIATPPPAYSPGLRGGGEEFNPGDFKPALSWALQAYDDEEERMKRWEQCVEDARRYFARKELVSIALEEVEEKDPATTPRGTVLEDALVVVLICRVLHTAIKEMGDSLNDLAIACKRKHRYQEGSPTCLCRLIESTDFDSVGKKTMEAIAKLQQTMYRLWEDWIGERDVLLMDGIDSWTPENPTQAIAFQTLKRMKAKSVEKQTRYLWGPVSHSLRNVAKGDKHDVYYVDERPFFGSTIETHHKAQSQDEEWCKTPKKGESRLMEVWTTITNQSQRRDGRNVSLRPWAALVDRTIERFGVGDDMTEIVKRPSVVTSATEPKPKATKLTGIAAQYLKNKVALEEAERSFLSRGSGSLTLRGGSNPDTESNDDIKLEAEVHHAPCSPSSTSLGPWGNHVGGCRPGSCAPGCTSILTLLVEDAWVLRGGAFARTLPDSPPLTPLSPSRNPSVGCTANSETYRPYLVWPSNAPFAPPTKGYYSPDYDVTGFWRRPVCPGELYQRLAHLPETGKWRWCDGREVIERVESVEYALELKESFLRG